MFSNIYACPINAISHDNEMKPQGGATRVLDSILEHINCLEIENRFIITFMMFSKEGSAKCVCHHLELFQMVHKTFSKHLANSHN